MYLVQRKKYWVLYDEKGKLLIQTYDRRIAEGFAKRIRKQKDDKRVQKRQEKIDNLINLAVGGIIILLGLIVFGSVIYFIGKGRGQW